MVKLRSTRRRRITRPRSRRNRLRLLLRGGKVRASTNPKSITYNPWNQVTLQYRKVVADASSLSIKVTDVYSWLKAQIGIPASDTAVLEMKIHNVSLIDMAGRAVLLEPHDTSSKNTSLTTLSDFPGRNSWASVRYVWPASYQNNPVLSTDGIILYAYGSGVTTTQIKDGTASIVHEVRLSWRFKDESLGPIDIFHHSMAGIPQPVSPISTNNYETDLSVDESSSDI